MTEVKTNRGEMRRVNVSLHDLCQPLTTLQCRLELAMMTDTMEGYREAAELGLVECRRLVAAVNQMREIVRSVAEATEIERKE